MKDIKKALDWIQANPSTNKKISEIAQDFGIVPGTLSSAISRSKHKVEKKPSMAAQAVAWLEENPGETAYAASLKFGLKNPASVYAAVARHQAKGSTGKSEAVVCGTCGKIAGTLKAGRKPSANSKTQQALALLEADPDMTPYAAAKLVGLANISGVYSAINAAEIAKSKKRCLECGLELEA